MGDEFDAFIEKLQEQVFDEAKEAFGETGFQRWRNPLYRGTLRKPDAHARITGKCGDTMEIFLKFNDDCVTGASYMTDGCGASTVCGSFAAEIAHGKTPDELTEITGETILKKIGRFMKLRVKKRSLLENSIKMHVQRERRFMRKIKR